MRERKNQRLNKGFTVVEVLIALSILMLVVFTFTPVMLHSFNLINQSAASEADVYAQQGEIEKQLAGRDNLTDAPSAMVPIKFNVAGAAEIPVHGKIIKGKGSIDFSTFIVDKPSAIGVIPGSLCDDMDLNGQTLTIMGNSLTFTNASIFKLYSMSSGKDTPINGCTFSLINDTTATLTLNDKISMAGSPYKITYGTAEATFSITPPAILIVGDKGTYIVSNGVADKDDNLRFIEKKGFLASQKVPQNLKAIAWNDKQAKYEVIGDLYNHNNTDSDKALYSYIADNTWHHFVWNRIFDEADRNIYHFGTDWFYPYRWKEPQPSNKFDEINLFTVGVTGDGNVIWGGYLTKNWTIQQGLYWNPQKWSDNPMSEEVGFYQCAPGSDKLVVQSPTIKSVNKIVTGYNSNTKKPIDVIFGNFHSHEYGNAHYTFNYGSSGFGENSININGNDKYNPVKGPIISATYGLIENLPTFKIATEEAIYTSPNEGIVPTNGSTTSYWARDKITSSNRPYPIRDITFGGGVWVAIGLGNYSIYCNDSTNQWRSSNKIPSANSDTVFNSISYSNGHFIAVGNDGIISTSPDGKNWNTTKIGTQNLNGVAGQ